MLEAVGEVFLMPNTNVALSTSTAMYSLWVPHSKMQTVAHMLKAIYAQENKAAVREKAKRVVESLRTMILPEAARKVNDGIDETLTCMSFPYQHWLVPIN